MKSMMVSTVANRVRRLIGDDNDLAVDSNELENPQRVDDSMVLGAIDFAGKEYVKFMDSTRAKRVYTFNSDGETKIPTDNMLLKDVWITDEAPDEYDPYEFFYLADHMVITYTFTDGRDLDTRTKLASPTDGIFSDSQFVDGYVNDNIGWNRAGVIRLDTYNDASRSILTWGGDNLGTGVESVWVDISKIRSLRPSWKNIKIDCRCFWYNTPGVNPVTLDIVLYKGGSVVPDGYGFANGTATDSKILGFATKAVTLSTRNENTNGERICVLSYNMETGYGLVDTEDVTEY